MSRDNPSNTEKTWRCILRSGSGHVSMALFNNFKSKSQGIRCRIDIRVLCSFGKTHCSVRVTFQCLYLSWQSAPVCDFTVHSRYRDRKLVSCKRGTPYVYLKDPDIFNIPIDRAKQMLGARHPMCSKTGIWQDANYLCVHTHLKRQLHILNFKLKTMHG